jgi:hypothetical protein
MPDHLIHSVFQQASGGAHLHNQQRPKFPAPVLQLIVPAAGAGENLIGVAFVAKLQVVYINTLIINIERAATLITSCHGLPSLSPLEISVIYVGSAMMLLVKDPSWVLISMM